MNQNQFGLVKLNLIRPCKKLNCIVTETLPNGFGMRAQIAFLAKKTLKKTNKKGEFMEHGKHYLLQFFQYSHLPEHLQSVSRPFCELACLIEKELPSNPELTTALRKLLEAKDCAVRSTVFR